MRGMYYSAKWLVRCDQIFDRPFLAAHVPSRACDNLDRIKLWIHECLSSHMECTKWSVSETKQPTRLLQLIPGGVRLRCDSSATDAPGYLAVSHMWGTDPSQQIWLVKARLAEFKR